MQTIWHEQTRKNNLRLVGWKVGRGSLCVCGGGGDKRWLGEGVLNINLGNGCVPGTVEPKGQENSQSLFEKFEVEV